MTRQGELNLWRFWKPPGPAPGLTGTPRHPHGVLLPAHLLPLPCCPGRVLRLDSVCLRPARAGRTSVLTPQMDSPSGWDRMQFLHQPWLRVGCGKGWGGCPV